MRRIDLIRQMPVDELAELLIALDYADRIPYCDGICFSDVGIDFEDVTYDMCKGCMIRYLDADGLILKEGA